MILPGLPIGQRIPRRVQTKTLADEIVGQLPRSLREFGIGDAPISKNDGLPLRQRLGDSFVDGGEIELQSDSRWLDGGEILPLDEGHVGAFARRRSTALELPTSGNLWIICVQLASALGRPCPYRYLVKRAIVRVTEGLRHPSSEGRHPTEQTSPVRANCSKRRSRERLPQLSVVFSAGWVVSQAG